jgi:hypothetical protein
MSVKKRLLLDGITLGASNVSPGNVEFAAAVEAHFADTGLALGNGAAVSAGKATQATIVQPFDESGIGFANALVEDGAEGGHLANFTSTLKHNRHDWGGSPDVACDAMGDPLRRSQGRLSPRLKMRGFGMTQFAVTPSVESGGRILRLHLSRAKARGIDSAQNDLLPDSSVLLARRLGLSA